MNRYNSSEPDIYVVQGPKLRHSDEHWVLDIVGRKYHSETLAKRDIEIAESQITSLIRGMEKELAACDDDEMHKYIKGHIERRRKDAASIKSWKIVKG